MFNSVLTRPLILILLVSLALNGLFGYLSYAFYSSKQALKSELIQCQASNTSLEKSVENHKEICKIQDSISTEWKKEEQRVEKDVDNSVDEIDKMITKTQSNTTSNVEEQNEKDSTIDLDSKLPDSLVRMLSENCLRAKGSSCTNP